MCHTAVPPQRSHGEGAMSITQIAQHAGVSPSTVSRYLRGTLDVNPDTAKRINEAALLHGYSPRTQKTASTILALIVPELRNPFYSALSQSIVTAAGASGFQVDIKVSHGKSAHEHELVDEVVRSQRYCGLLYAGLNSHNDALARVIPSAMHIVLLDECIDDSSLPPMNMVTVDNYSGAYRAVRYLLSLGHQRIAYLSGPYGLSTAKERLRGYSDALAAAHIQQDSNIIFSGPYTEEFGSSIFPYIIENPAPPTAIFCSSDIAAIGLLGAAEQYGFKIPDDLSVIGCDGIHVGQWLRPSLTTLQQPIEDIAHAAIELVTHDGPAKHVQLPLNLVIRDSTQRKER